MTTLQRPLNEDYSHTEGSNSDGSIPSRSTSEQAAFAKKSRLKRERGRFKLNDWFMNLSFSNTGWIDHDDQFYQQRTDYYEKVEVTEDTIRNKSFSKEERLKLLDDGGDFTHYIIEYKDSKPTYVNYRLVNDPTENWTFQVFGHICTIPWSFNHLEIDIVDSIEPPEELLDISALGPKMWGAMRPTKPLVELGVAIAELRDLPRMYKHSLDTIKSVVKTLANPKSLPEWFLAIQFGWKPLVSDVQKLVKTQQKLKSRLQYLKHNVNKPTFRHVEFNPAVTTQTLFTEEGSDNSFDRQNFDALPAGSDPDSIVNRFKNKITLRKTVTDSASGTFIYYWDGKFPNDEFLIAQLHGVVPNEATIWSAFPWTWLVDWFVNVGDVISNLKNNLGASCVSTSAYSQRTILLEYTWHATNGYFSSSITRSFEIVLRRKIDPFGLALESPLSALQEGILAALALTRV